MGGVKGYSEGSKNKGPIRISDALFDFFEEMGMIGEFIDCYKDEVGGCWLMATPEQLKCMKDALGAKAGACPTLEGLIADLSVADAEKCQPLIDLLKPKIDTNTRYTFELVGPNEDDDCVVTATPDDGGDPQTWVIPKPPLETDGIHYSGDNPPTLNAAGILSFPTVNDLDESPAPRVSVDLSSLISDPTFFAAGGDITLTGDGTAGNPYTYSYTDVDQVYNAGDNITFVTEPDGSITISTATVIDVDANIAGARNNTLQTDNVNFTPTIRDWAGTDNSLNSANSDVLTLKDIRDLGLGFSVPFVDSGDGCTPADVTNDCLVEAGLTTCTPLGDVWESAAGSGTWVLKTVSTNTDFAGLVSAGTGVGTFSAGGSVVLVDASATGGADEISPLIGSGETALATLERTITNNDCVDWIYRYDIRALAQWSGVGEGARINLGIGSSASHTAQAMLGQPDDIYDTREVIPGAIGQESKDYLHTFSLGRLAVGASVTISAESFVNVQDFTAGVGNTAASGQSVSVNSLAGRVQVWRIDKTRNMI